MLQQPRDRDPTAVADYIAEILDNLAAMARGHRLDTLVYLLEMACLEARTITNTPRNWQADQAE